jgi:hypothetical protein
MSEDNEDTNFQCDEMSEFNKRWIEVSKSDMAHYLYDTLNTRQKFYAQFLIEYTKNNLLNDVLSLAKDARDAFSDFEVFPNDSDTYMKGAGSLLVEQRVLQRFWFTQMTSGVVNSVLNRYNKAWGDVCYTFEFRGIRLGKEWRPYLPSSVSHSIIWASPLRKKRCSIM